MYVISVAAELTGLHPQTLRAYERMGLIAPGRTGGGGRRYSHRDLERLREIADLTGAGIGIEGVRRIMALELQVDALRARNEELVAELDAVRRGFAAARRGPGGRPHQQAPGAAPGRRPVGRRLAPTAMSLDAGRAGRRAVGATA